MGPARHTNRLAEIERSSGWEFKNRNKRLPELDRLVYTVSIGHALSIALYGAYTLSERKRTHAAAYGQMYFSKGENIYCIEVNGSWIFGSIAWESILRTRRSRLDQGPLGLWPSHKIKLTSRFHFIEKSSKKITLFNRAPLGLRPHT